MNILACIDFSNASDKLVTEAIQFARQSAASLWMLHVADPDPDFVGYKAGPQSVRDGVAKQFHREHQQLQAMADRAREAGVEVTALLVQGPTVETILNEASKLNAGVIVVGSHGHGAMYQMLMGSVSEGVIRQANCPVLVVPVSA